MNDVYCFFVSSLGMIIAKSKRNPDKLINENQPAILNDVFLFAPPDANNRLSLVPATPFSESESITFNPTQIVMYFKPLQKIVESYEGAVKSYNDMKSGKTLSSTIVGPDGAPATSSSTGLVNVDGKTIVSNNEETNS